MSRFVLTELPLSGLRRVERGRMGDNRGYLSRLFCSEELGSSGWVKPIVQVNFTFTSKRGTVRGMHFQHPPHAEMKLVSCIRGRIWDVAVDLRANSPTFLQWHAETLSAENHMALLIPEGFSHGFQSLSDDVELLYCHTSAYNAEAESGLNPQDARLAIQWPLEISELSKKDQQFPVTDTQFEGLVL